MIIYAITVILNYFSIRFIMLDIITEDSDYAGMVAASILSIIPILNIGVFIALIICIISSAIEDNPVRFEQSIVKIMNKIFRIK